MNDSLIHRLFAAMSTLTLLGVPDMGFAQEKLLREKEKPKVVKRDQVLEASEPIISGETAIDTFRALRVWPAGKTVKVAFRGGDEELYRKIAVVATEWAKYGNIKFDFGFDETTRSFRQWSPKDRRFVADIRVGFEEPGYWSFVGTDSVDPVVVHPGDVSLNLQGFDDALPPNWRFIVLHEFGHALGLPNAHQHPNIIDDLRLEDDEGYLATTDNFGRLLADKKGRMPGIYSQLSGSPNYWSKAQIDTYVGPVHPHYQMVEFDAKSVMLDTLPAVFFKSGKRSKWFKVDSFGKLSDGDKVAIEAFYPFRKSHNRRSNASEIRRFTASVLNRNSELLLPSDFGPGWVRLKPVPRQLEGTLGSDDTITATRAFQTILTAKSACRIVASHDFDRRHPVLHKKFENGRQIGSGILVSKSLILTNFHVLPSDDVAKLCEVQFGHVEDVSKFKSIFPGKHTFQIDKVIANSHWKSGLDYSLVRIKYDTRIDAWSKVSLRDIQIEGESLYSTEIPVTVIHFPQKTEGFMSFDWGRMTHTKLNTPFIFHTTDTDHGSSGSPVFDKYWTLIGLHRGIAEEGDVPADIERNKAVRIDRIVEHILSDGDVPGGVVEELGLRRRTN